MNKGTGGVGHSVFDVNPASAPAPAANGTLPPLVPGGTQAPATPAAPASGAPAKAEPPAPAKPAAPGVPTN
jgi:hypothetical protein